MELKLSTFEIFLIQIVGYGGLWLMNEYVASYLCLILPVVIAAILLISWIADLIEPARVGRKYYKVMAVSIMAPIIVAAFFVIISGGRLAWLNESF